ncbi:hypothetical protein ACWC09_06795 [Streptomyces sp. NPDC001617]
MRRRRPGRSRRTASPATVTAAPLLAGELPPAGAQSHPGTILMPWHIRRHRVPTARARHTAVLAPAVRPSPY